jgi:DNA polymerase-3 subunit alpha
LVRRGNRIVRPEGYTIPYNAVQIHGITTERALAEGDAMTDVLADFREDLSQASYITGHNVGFDVKILGAEWIRLGEDAEIITDRPVIDSKDEGTAFCAIPGGKGGAFKWPTLTELHEKLFGEPFAEAHDAAYDVAATARCFFGLIQRGVVVRPGWPAPADVHYEAPVLEAANFSSPAAEARPGRRCCCSAQSPRPSASTRGGRCQAAASASLRRRWSPCRSQWAGGPGAT